MVMNATLNMLKGTERFKEREKEGEKRENADAQALPPEVSASVVLEGGLGVSI